MPLLFIVFCRGVEAPPYKPIPLSLWDIPLQGGGMRGTDCYIAWRLPAMRMQGQMIM